MLKAIDTAIKMIILYFVVLYVDLRNKNASKLIIKGEHRKMESVKFDRQLNRTIYFDYLRVFAAFSVMILHISAQNWYSTDVNSFEWQTFNFFDSIVRWGVPIFVMISGALFLNGNIPLKKIYTKYVLRMVIAYIVWSFVYVCFSQGNIISRIADMIKGHYHMWFIFMIVGLYICLPFIQSLVKDDRTTKYFLLLAFIFAYLIPQIVTLTNDFAGELVIKGVTLINSDISNMDIHIVMGFTSYFVLGYLLNKIDLSKKQRTIIYLLGIIGFTLTIVLDLIVALKTQQYCQNYYDYFTINVLFESVAIFTWFKYKKYRIPKLHPIIIRLSKYSFGAYLVHALIIEQLNTRLGLNTLSFNAVLSVICIGLIVFICSFIVSGILNHVPVLKKYIV